MICSWKLKICLDLFLNLTVSHISASVGARWGVVCWPLKFISQPVPLVAKYFLESSQTLFVRDLTVYRFLMQMKVNETPKPGSAEWLHAGLYLFKAGLLTLGSAAACLSACSYHVNAPWRVNQCWEWSILQSGSSFFSSPLIYLDFHQRDVTVFLYCSETLWFPFHVGRNLEAVQCPGWDCN